MGSFIINRSKITKWYKNVKCWKLSKISTYFFIQLSLLLKSFSENLKNSGVDVLVKLTKISEQLYYRTPVDSCIFIVAFIKFG